MAIQRRAGDWTDERVKALWDYEASLGDRVPYFSRYHAVSIVRFLKLCGALHGRVLDYGAGPGFLLDAILRAVPPVEGYAIEFSPDSIAALETRLGNLPNFKQASCVEALPSSYPDSHFNTVVCVEVVEHLSDELLSAVISELFRLVKPGGTVFITTPHQENFDEALVFCPFCDSEFHRYQHMRTWSIQSLQTTLESAGFKVPFCRNIEFDNFSADIKLPPLRHLSPALFRRFIMGRMAIAADRRAAREPLQGRELLFRALPGPHLVAVATKPLA